MQGTRGHWDSAVKRRDIRRTLGLDVCRVSLLWMALMCRLSITGQDLPREYLNAAPEVSYVGDGACRACHPAEFASFKRTGMGRSMRPASVADELGPSAVGPNFGNCKLEVFEGF